MVRFFVFGGGRSPRCPAERHAQTPAADAQFLAPEQAEDFSCPTQTAHKVTPVQTRRLESVPVLRGRRTLWFSPNASACFSPRLRTNRTSYGRDRRPRRSADLHRTPRRRTLFRKPFVCSGLGRKHYVFSKFYPLCAGHTRSPFADSL